MTTIENIYRVLTCLLLPMVLTGCLTNSNGKIIERYRNPGTEFKLYEKTGWTYPPRTVTGTLSRTNGIYCLRIHDLMYNDKDLQLLFPVTPTLARNSDLKVTIISEQKKDKAPFWSIPVDLSGTAMSFSNGAPTRVSLRVYWAMSTHGCNWVEYTLNYMSGPTNGYTAKWSGELPWNRRSHLVQGCHYANYVWMFPVDVVTSPLQGIVYMLTPHWHD